MADRDAQTAEFAHLRTLAEGATPGPWEVPESIHGDPYITEAGKGILRGGCVALADTRDDYGRSNAAYIAAANPAVVLALLDRLAAAEALAKAWEAEASHPDGHSLLVQTYRSHARELRATVSNPPVASTSMRETGGES